MTIEVFTRRQAAETRRWDRLIDAMHRDRAATFKARLGWMVEVDELGWEIDRFDTQEVNPLYLVSVDDAGAYRGSLRLLPTTGPNMLRDVFPQLLEPGQTVESATIWESSRITAKTPEAFPELIAGIAEVGVKAGLTMVVTVVDQRVKRMLRALHCPFDVIGSPCKIGGIMCYALAIIDTEMTDLRRRAGLTGPVLAKPTYSAIREVEELK